MASFSYWRGVAQSSGASGLAAITDGTSSDDPSGTDCNKAYWEAKAYDQLVAIYTSLSSEPGSGVDGNFIINQDATSSTNSSLIFSTGGTLQYGEPTLTWVSSNSTFNFSHDLVSQISLGSTSTRLTKVWSADADISGTLTLGSSSTLTSTGSASFSSLSVSTLSLGGNIQTDGTSLTFNHDYTGSSPSENGSIVVERGSQNNAILRFTESNDRWQVYDLGSSAYKDIAIFDSNGFTYTEMFAGSGGNHGSANTVARSDHSHSFGTVGASGTSNTYWDIDSDYSSGSSNIETRFGGSSRYIRINPNDSTPLFTFSHGASLANLTITSGITFSGSGAIAADLPIAGDEITFLSTNAGAPTGNADLTVNRGNTTDTRLRWNEAIDRWTFTNDGSTYYRLIGTDGSDNLTTPASLTITGDITGSLTSQGSYTTLRNTATSGGDGFYRVKTGASSYASLKWVNASSKWQTGNGTNFSDIVTHDASQTLTNKTLTSPAISTPTITNGGSWGGNPTISGNPSLTGTPAFSGTPTFVGATFSGRPAFNADYTAAPFTVSSPTLVTNLNADRVDNKHVDDTQSASTNYLWTSDKVQEQIDASSGTPSAHASTHGAAGSDAISGITNISGTTQDTFTIQTGATHPATIQLGSSSKFRVQIKDYSNNRMGLGGQNVSIVPQSTGQVLGDSANRWDQLWINKYLNSNLIASSDYPTTNGSLWFASGSPSSFMVRLGGTIHTLVNSSGVSNNNHSHSGYLPTSGGTLSGLLKVQADLEVDSSGTDLLYAATGYDKVGIGYTPSSAGGGKLEVYGASSWAGSGESIARFRSGGSDARIHVNSTSGAGQFKAYTIYEDGNTSTKYSTGLDGGAYKITTGTTLSGTQRLKIDSSGNWDIGDSGTSYNAKFHGDTGAKAYWYWYSGGGVDKYHYMKRYQPPAAAAFSMMHINAASDEASPGYNLIVSGTIQHNGIYSGSDSRLKSNIADIETALDNVTQLQGVTFNWKENKELEFDVPVKGEGRQYGFIAQDVEKVLPDVVQGDGDDIKSLKYDALIPVLVEAIKELKAEIETLKAGS